jgi:hypothetical protein
MVTQSLISPEFFADLEVVCPNVDDGNLPPNFVEDLEIADAHAQASASPESVITLAELVTLGEELTGWRTHHQQLLQQYLAQLPADDPLRSPVSLFGAMDFGRLETAHTRALAWLLGDREHGFRFRLLKALLLYLLEGRSISLTGVDRVEREYPVRCGPTEKGRIDILAEGRWEEQGNEVPWRLVIEAKIDAEEGDQQLSLYDDWLELSPQPAEVLRVFLTQDGREPQTSLAGWQPLSFLELASLLRRVSAGLEDRPGYHYLRYYLTGVLREICGLPVPVSAACENPYAAVDYLQSVLGVSETEDGHGHSR